MIKQRLIIITFLCLFSNILNKNDTDTLESTYIYSIESMQKNSQKGWNTSAYTAAYPYGFTVKFNKTGGNSLFQELSPIGKGGIINFGLQEESYGIQISSLKVFQNDTLLEAGKEAVIVSDVSKNVLPNNYYDTSHYTKTMTKETMKNTKAQCLYKNPGPMFSRAILKSVAVDSVVNLINRNLGLKFGQPGIKVITMTNFILTYESLDEYLKKWDDDQKYTSTNNITFSKLFITQDNHDNHEYMSKEFLLAALANDSTLYLYNVTDNNYDSIDFKQFAIIPKSVFNYTGIMKVDLCDDKLVVATKRNGLTILTRDQSDGFKWKSYVYDKFNNSNFNISDSLVINSTALIIADGIGLISFDLKMMKYNTDYFAHPHLHSIDSTIYDGMSYIGVVVNNNPPSIPEFYIEFAFNYANPSRPMINKVFTSINDISLNDIASDPQLGLTYIFNSHSHVVIVLNRGVPNSLKTYNFRVNFLNYYNFKSEFGMELFLLSSNDNFYPHLIIKNGEDYILLGKFSFPKNSLRCKFNDYGNYRFEFSAPSDCSVQEKGLFDYQVCWNNSTFEVIVDNRPPSNMKYNGVNGEGDEPEDGLSAKDEVTLFVILGVLTIAAIIIITTVICCRKGKYCSKKNNQLATVTSNKSKIGIGNVDYVKHSNSNNGEIVEVNVIDNKL